MISIVVPAYNEESNLAVLYANVREVMDGLGDVDDWEIVIVDDGSTDATWKVIETLNAASGRVRAAWAIN